MPHHRSLKLLLVLCAALSACGPDWREYRSQTGKYTIEFPGKAPTERTQPGRGATVHLAHVEIDRTTAYGVSWFDIEKPTKPIAELLRDMQAEVLRDLGATPSQVSDIRLGSGPGEGAPGRAFMARTSTNLDVSIRLYAVGTGPDSRLSADRRRARCEPRRARHQALHGFVQGAEIGAEIGGRLTSASRAPVMELPFR